MPFVEGESLRNRLDRDKQIPFDEAVELTREIASALAYAHGQGLVHRDIKPENILLTGGHAMLADFGIARAVGIAQQGKRHTGLGFAVGTPGYMSPEQATASELDARTDQYSLAAVFYEMVSGEVPFSGPTVQAALAQSLTGPRPKLTKLVRTVPPDADPVVARALASDPAERYPTIMAFAEDLVRSGGGGQAVLTKQRRLLGAVAFFSAAFVISLLALVFWPREPIALVRKEAEVIAVAPFTTSGPGVETLGEGMVDLLSANLNTVGGIRVVEPRLVLAQWRRRGNPADPDAGRSLARAVNANSVLTGSLVSTGNRVRIAAALHGLDGTELAKAQVDGASDSVLVLVDRLSADLVRGIWQSNEPYHRFGSAASPPTRWRRCVPSWTANDSTAGRPGIRRSWPFSVRSSSTRPSVWRICGSVRRLAGSAAMGRRRRSRRATRLGDLRIGCRRGSVRWWRPTACFLGATARPGTLLAAMWRSIRMTSRVGSSWAKPITTTARSIPGPRRDPSAVRPGHCARLLADAGGPPPGRDGDCLP